MHACSPHRHKDSMKTHQPTSIVCLRSTALTADPRTKRFSLWLREAGFEAVCIGWDRLGDTPGTSPEKTSILAHIPGSYGGGMRLAWPLARWQWFLLKWLIQNRNRYQVIQAADLDTVLPAVLMKALFKKKVVYDIHDYYVDSHILPAILRQPLKRLEDFVVSYVDTTIIVSDARRSQLKDTRPRVLEVIPNVPEHREVSGRADDGTATLRLVYVGILVDCRGLFELCDVIRKHADWRLDIGGRGPAEPDIRSIADESDNIHFYGRLEYSDTLALTATADCLIATYDPSIPNHRHSSPNKFGEALMCGKPLIVAKGTSIDQLVLHYNVGFVVPYGDKAELERVLSIIASWTPAERASYSTHVKAVYNEHFSTDQMKKRLLALYAAVQGSTTNMAEPQCTTA